VPLLTLQTLLTLLTLQTLLPLLTLQTLLTLPPMKLLPCSTAEGFEERRIAERPEDSAS
jgi:hypothetical protein